MAFLQVNNVEVAGMAAAVPTMVENNVDIYGKWEGMRTSLLQLA